MLNQMALPNFLTDEYLVKGLGQGVVSLNSLWSLKRGPRTSYFAGASAIPRSRTIGFMRSSIEKKSSLIRNLCSGKQYKIPHFCRYALETFIRVFADSLNLVVDLH